MVAQHFTITSPAFANADTIPAVHSRGGRNISPPIAWHDPPGAARSFVLVMDDPDASKGTFTHWVLFDIPAEVRELPSDDHETGVAGRNDFAKDGYGDPCPPQQHGPHRYYFQLFALDIESLNLPQGSARTQVETAMQGHIVAEAELMGRYARTGAK